MNDKPTGISPSQPTAPVGGVEPMPTQTPAKAQAREMKASASQEFESLKQDASHQTHETLESVKSEARQALTDAREAGSRIVSDQKAALVQKVHQYEEAIRAAAETLRSEQENILAGPAERAARQLGQICDYLEHREPEDLIHEAEDLARRRPELVFGGLLVAGFAVSRFLKSSRRRPRSRAIGTARAGRGSTGQAVPLARDTSLARSGALQTGQGGASYGQPGVAGQQVGVGMTPTTHPALASEPSSENPTINRPSV